MLRNAAHNTALFGQLKNISDATCEILDSAGEIATPVRRTVESCDILFELVTGIVLSPAAIKRDAAAWALYVRAARVLDRALALIAALNAELMERLDFSPFHGLLVAGEGLSAAVDRRLVASSQSQKSRGLYFSPGLISAADAGAIRYVVPHDVTPEARHYLLAGAAGDVIDLLEELRKGSGLQQPILASSVIADWQRVCRSLGVRLLLREKWTCGLLYSLEEFVDVCSLDQAEIEQQRIADRLLWMHMWDGSIVYPEIQVDAESGGGIYGFLPALLEQVVESWSRWHLALWLGAEDASGVKRVTRLRDPRGFGRVREELVRLEKVDKRFFEPVTPAIKNGLAEVRRVDKKMFLPKSPRNLAYDQASSDEMGLSATSENETEGLSPFPWGMATGTNLTGRVHRITRSGHGPFRYGHARLDGSGGRFDVSVVGRGTCYFAQNAVGAMQEVFGRVPVFSLQEVASRSRWELILVDRVGPLLDLTDAEVTMRLHLDMDIFGSSNRGATQALADLVEQADYRGIVYPLFRLPGSLGIALFGDEGMPGGHGLWHMIPVSLVADRAFWKWLDEAQLDQIDMFTSQLPGDSPRP